MVSYPNFSFISLDVVIFPHTPIPMRIVLAQMVSSTFPTLDWFSHSFNSLNVVYLTFITIMMWTILNQMVSYTSPTLERVPLSFPHHSGWINHNLWCIPLLIQGVRRFETFLPWVKLHILLVGISPTPLCICCMMLRVYLPLDVCQTL